MRKWEYLDGYLKKLMDINMLIKGAYYLYDFLELEYKKIDKKIS